MQVNVVEVERGGAEREVRVAPESEPLASCAFRWPPGWTVDAPPWVPPDPLAVSTLCALDGEDGRLDIQVARFGMEVDGLTFAREHLGWPAPGRWRGLTVAAVDTPARGHRVVQVGPALHLLTASGGARAHLDGAAASLRSLSGLGPAAEPIVPLALGPLRTLRLGAWTVDEVPATRRAPGYAARRLRLLTPRGDLAAWLSLEVVDRRVHVGADPEDFRSAGRAPWAPAVRGPDEADPGAGGPATRAPGEIDGHPVEVREALRQVGPALVLLGGVWPSSARAPLVRLHARRQFDLLLACARPR